MSLYKRNDSPNWWIKLTHNGRRIQRSTGTTDCQKAQEYHDKLKAALWDQERLGIKPKRTWNEAVVKWSKEASHKPSFKAALIQLRMVDPFLNGMDLDAINRDRLDQIIEYRLDMGVSNAAVNRTMEIIRAILRKAADEWEWINRAPKVRMLPEPKVRIRFLTHDEADRLIAELPSHLAAMVRFTLETGLRQRNVTQLEWSQVDLDKRTAWIHADQAKARKAIAVPLTEAAMTVLREQEGQHKQYVFTYNGQSVKQPNNHAFRKALKRAGIENFRWHDLRHTWATWHVQAGTPLNVLQELGGWSCYEMVLRYAHLNADFIRPFAERMSMRSPTGYKTATLRLVG